MTPIRIQRKRTKGWRMPEGAVYVGRPSRWGNPWTVGHRNPWGDPQLIDAATAVELFRYGIDHPFGRQVAREALRGRDLACWCPLDQACHGDVLLELANR